MGRTLFTGPLFTGTQTAVPLKWTPLSTEPLRVAKSPWVTENPNSLMLDYAIYLWKRYADGEIFGPFRIGRFRPVPPVELDTAESAVSEIGRSFPRLWLWGRVARRGADFPRPPRRPTEIAGAPHRLPGPSLRMARLGNDDFIDPPVLRAQAPGQWIFGDGARNRGPPSPRI